VSLKSLSYNQFRTRLDPNIQTSYDIADLAALPPFGATRAALVLSASYKPFALASWTHAETQRDVSRNLSWYVIACQ
jgi:hypothetical protein